MFERKKREESNLPVPYWTPSDLVSEMEKAIEDFRRGMETFWYPRMGITAPRTPMMDLKEEENRYVVEVELPGMTKEDVSIELDDEMIIRAKKEREVEEKKEDYIRRERGYASFYRRFPLPPNVDTEKIDAKMESGVLHIVLPKTKLAEEKRKKIEIK